MTVPIDTPTRSDKGDDNTVWYFAYGSNMDPKIFTGRRKVTPIESLPVSAPGYWLSFDIAGIPFIEPCFASILKIDTTRLHSREYALEVHNRTRYGQVFEWDESNPEKSFPPVLQGVAHRITLRDWQLVIQSEGGWGHDVPTGYNQIVIPCLVVGSGDGDSMVINNNGEKGTVITKQRALQAHVLEARPTSVKAKCQPTLRYKNLLTAGARFHNLDPAYQRYLAHVVPYECDGVRSKTGRVIFTAFNLPMVLLFAAIVFRDRGTPVEKRTRPPFWTAWIFDKAARFSTMIHDYLVMPIFGSGRCSTPGHQAVVRKRIEDELKKVEDGKEDLVAVQQKCENDDEAKDSEAVKAVKDTIESLAE
ncbi:hypothetical protein BG004_006056 [Podila humilis]|nr:hypothetical protein BG004_006056 [Podila humilis]